MVQSLVNTLPFFVFVFRLTLNHIPLKYKFPNKFSKLTKLGTSTSASKLAGRYSFLLHSAGSRVFRLNVTLINYIQIH